MDGLELHGIGGLVYAGCVQYMCVEWASPAIYSFGFGSRFSMASATFRRWILPVAVLGICGTIQI